MADTNKMRLHWSPRSPFVRKVMIAAHELGLADQIETTRTRVATNQVHKGLLSDNPLGKIPTLILTDGTILYDSVVICEYLDSIAAKPKLFPPSGPARFKALRCHALGSELKHAATIKALEAEAPALAQDDFGIGHIAIACALSYLDFRFDALQWRKGAPALTAWHAAAVARPSFMATTVVDD